MKILFFVFPIFLFISNINSQSKELDSLLVDSMLIRSLEEDFAKEELHLYSIKTKLLHYNHRRQLRSIKIYAHVFEELFRRGFDLNWDICTNSVSTNSCIYLRSFSQDTIVSLERRSFLSLNNENHYRSNLIHRFIRIKDRYEENVIGIKDSWEETVTSFDETENHESVKAFVDNLILYGNYRQPKTLRKILLGQYEWYNEELRNRCR